MDDEIFIILDKIIDNKFKISNSGGKIIVQEKDNRGECKEVKITTNNKVFALSLDNNYKVFNCFNSSEKNITTKNDGVIFFIKSNKLIVLLVELKSKNTTGYLKQLKAGKNFIEYLLKQVNLLYHINIDSCNVIFRAILFDTNNRKVIPKGTTHRIKLKFINRNNLLCASLNCNASYKLQMIKESIEF